MVLSKEHRIFSRSFAQADASNDDNIIRGVSLITAGPAIGHDCQIDGETISGLYEASKKFKNGIRANLGHFTGMENCFGHITNPRINGDKLIGDLNLFSEHKDFSLIKKQITTIPDTFGFSVYFDGPDEEKEQEVDGVKVKIAFARCETLMSADLVDCPAANPSGVFERKFIQGPTARGQVDNSTVDAQKDIMAKALENPEDLKTLIKECMADVMKSHSEHMDEISGKVDDLCKKAESIGTNDTPVKKDEGAAELDEKEGKAKDESPNGMSKEDDDKKEPKMDEKEFSKRLEANNKALEARITNGLLKALSDQKISPPATATATSATDGVANGKTKHGFKTYHEACRNALSQFEKSATPKSDAMKFAAREYPDLYKAYCMGQTALSRGEGGEWTTEAIFMTPEKHSRRLSIIAAGGRLT